MLCDVTNGFSVYIQRRTEEDYIQDIIFITYFVNPFSNLSSVFKCVSVFSYPATGA